MKARSSRFAVSLAHFTTEYRRDAEHRARAFNVELAAAAIDGATVAPGATFSFNRAVGERTPSGGYRRGTVLRDRLLAEGTGGGTCQVASTLHAAALLAGLAIVERAPHSRPSGYIRMGLDATVVYPRLDLQLRNPRSEPVVIRARAAGGDLTVSIEAASAERPDVVITSDVLERIPFQRAIERDESLGADVVRVIAYGIPGFRVRRTREIRSPEGLTRRDVRTDLYPPTDERIAVAPSFDLARLAHPRGREDEDGRESGDGEADPDDIDAPKRPSAGAPTYEDGAAVRPVRAQVRPAARATFTNQGG